MVILTDAECSTGALSLSLSLSLSLPLPLPSFPPSPPPPFSLFLSVSVCLSASLSLSLSLFLSSLLSLPLSPPPPFPLPLSLSAPSPLPCLLPHLYPSSSFLTHSLSFSILTFRLPLSRFPPHSAFSFLPHHFSLLISFTSISSWHHIAPCSHISLSLL